jgi:Flp pilus assembly protein TadG
MAAGWPRVSRVPRVPLCGGRRAGRPVRGPGAPGMSRRPGAPGMSRGPGADRGSSAVELVILTPMLLALIWLIIQYALYYQGRQVALAAAQIGARVARQDANTLPGWRAIAEHSAESYYAGLGTRVLGGTVTAVASPVGVSEVKVTVTGQAASIMFGLTLTIHETASGPVECFRPDLNGGQQC